MPMFSGDRATADILMASDILTASEAEEGLVAPGNTEDVPRCGHRVALAAALACAGLLLLAGGVLPGERLSSPAKASLHKPLSLQEEGGDCAASGVDCREAQCCKTGGHQCYRKSEEWAQCLPECAPGQMNGKDTDGTWTCDELGPRAETTGACATKGGDCADSQCCSMPGMQCYRKDDFWASCMVSCTPAFVNDDPTDPKSWTCEELGQRSAGEAVEQVLDDDFWRPKSDTTWPAGSAAKCSWPAESCLKSKCCRMNGFDCYEVNEYWASCMETCNETVKDSDGNPATCEKLGESKSNQDPVGQADGDDPLGSSLYCIVVAKEDSYETKLVAAMEENGVGIFECEGHGVFHGREAKMGEWGSVSNVDVFIDIWNQVKEEGEYSNHDWVVKVDPDAVFLPSRLKAHIEGLMAPSDTKTGIYLKNIDYLFGFMGSLEVFTSTALDTYLKGMDDCSEYFGHSGGEDYYLMTCFDALGVTHMNDLTLLKDKYGYADHRPFNLTSVAHCRDDVAAAFHPHKSAERWMACHGVANGAPMPAGESPQDDQDIGYGDQAGVGDHEGGGEGGEEAGGEGGEGGEQSE